MKYVAEVTALLMQSAEKRYEISKGDLDNAQNGASIPPDQLAKAQSEHMRAAKEYLAIAFKTRFLEQSTRHTDENSV